jgi:hypothetical protein
MWVPSPRDPCETNVPEGAQGGSRDGQPADPVPIPWGGGVSLSLPGRPAGTTPGPAAEGRGRTSEAAAGAAEEECDVTRPVRAWVACRGGGLFPVRDTGACWEDAELVGAG